MRPISNAASWLVLAGVTVLLSAASAGPSAARSIPPGGRPLGAAARGVGPRLHFVGPGRIRETVEALFRNSPSIHEHADAAGDLADDAAAAPSPTCRRSYIGNTVRLLAARPATTVPTSHLSRTTTLFASLGTIATRGGAKGGPGDVSGTGFWPPWPFNLMRKPGTSSGSVGDGKNGDVGDASNGSIQYTKSTGVFWTYAAHRAKVWARQCQQIGSDLSFHLPPAAPPLLLIALLPAKGRGAASEQVSRAMIRRSAFARRVSLSSLGVAIISWAHYEIRQQKRLVPLPLRDEYRDYKKAILPTFLPEVTPSTPPPLDESSSAPNGEEGRSELTDSALLNQDTNSKLRLELEYLYKAAPRPDTVVPTMKELLRLRGIRQQREEGIRRKAIVEELMALQVLRKRSRIGRGSRHVAPKAVARDGEPPLGFALVTGASRGIGRALAVELARWEIPLILVARNVSQLKALADDIVSCYGVPCCILQADLSEPDAAAKVYRTTKDAGLRVDILINNAGICKHGEFVESPIDSIQDVVQINAGSVAMLSHLYGKDMKRQRRGRMLFVSSIVGAMNAGPGVAAYAATKAFEKSLAVSMGKELEPYGCGVTCLMPGAVKGTAFRYKSKIDDAVCWKIPFYPRSAQEVAKRGVRAMLAGDPECCPGWQNKLFLRAIVPMLPQRLTTMIVEFCWNPLELPWQSPKENFEGSFEEEHTVGTTPKTPRPRFSFWDPSPSILQPRTLKTPTAISGSRVDANADGKTEEVCGEQTGADSLSTAMDSSLGKIGIDNSKNAELDDDAAATFIDSTDATEQADVELKTFGAAAGEDSRNGERKEAIEAPVDARIQSSNSGDGYLIEHSGSENSTDAPHDPSTPPKSLSSQRLDKRENEQAPEKGTTIDWEKELSYLD